MTNISKFKPLRDSVFVDQLDSGAHVTKGGIITLDDNMKEKGIRPRWARVCALGPDVDDLSVGEWVLVQHGRWTNGMNVEDDNGTTKMWRIEYPKAVILVADTDPRTDIILV